jgi:hypothetical protein
MDLETAAQSETIVKLKEKMDQALNEVKSLSQRSSEAESKLAKAQDEAKREIDQLNQEVGLEFNMIGCEDSSAFCERIARKRSGIG